MNATNVQFQSASMTQTVVAGARCLTPIQPMTAPRPLRSENIPQALSLAARYRLLHEPSETESICLDVLEVDPDNQEALALLVLALTDSDSTGQAQGIPDARPFARRLRCSFERAYYLGIIAERRAKGRLSKHSPGAAHVAYEGLREAMGWYEQAAPKNDDAILRWNTCARLIARNRLSARLDEHPELPLE